MKKQKRYEAIKVEGINEKFWSIKDNQTIDSDGKRETVARVGTKKEAISMIKELEQGGVK